MHAASGQGDAAGFAGPSTAGPSVRPAPAKKKKVKPAKAQKGLHRQRTIPKPYLALAPSPISSYSASVTKHLSSSSLANLVLPSSFPRGSGLANNAPPAPSQPVPAPPVATSSRPPTRTRQYAAGLLAPPLIMPGGTSAEPRLQASARSGRRTPTMEPELSAAQEIAMQRNRSRERLREISSGANASMMSLGIVGRTLGGEQQATSQDDGTGPIPDQVAARRRRRIVRGEDGARRRLTVTSREEGRAMGLARGASMRRVNVWDDLPESSDPPPAFPFPTTATNRLPPTFETSQSPPATSPSAERPRSPPPTFEQATGLVLLPLTNIAEAEEEPPDRPTIQITTENDDPSPHSRPSTPGTDYASARQSPTGSMVPLPDNETTEQERQAREMWHSDLLAGYPLEERVRREMMRRKSREEGMDGLPDDVSAIPTPSEGSAAGSTSLMEASKEVSPQTRLAEPIIQEGSTSAASITPRSLKVITTATTSSPAAFTVRASPVSPETPKASKTLTKALSKKEELSPKTPKLMLRSSVPDLTMASIIANPPTIRKNPTSPVSPTDATPTLSRERSLKPLPAEPVPQDAVIDESPPSRKLSRGKAVRRSSSGLKSETGSVRSRRTPESPKQPLFSSPGMTATEILHSPPDPRVAFAHRTSDPTSPLHTTSPDRPAHTRIRSQPDLHRIAEDVPVASSGLPPHREAALRRRELALPRVQEMTKSPSSSAPTSPVKSLPSAFSMEPLIDLTGDFSVYNPPTKQAPVENHSTWTAELLQLLEEVSSPVAESSAQGAARIAAAEIVKAEVEAAVEAKVKGEQDARSLEAETRATDTSSTQDHSRHSETQSSDGSTPTRSEKRPAPPPPISLRLKHQQDGAIANSPSGVMRKQSVLSTADSPLLPLVRPSSMQSPISPLNPTPSSASRSAPTRRPPPLPPFRFQTLAPPPEAVDEGPSPPPSFVEPPPNPRLQSFSTSDSSDRDSPEPPPRRPHTSVSLMRRPKGPRPPPPVPIRPFAKVPTQTFDEPVRVSLRDDQFPNITLAIDTADVIAEETPPRSASAQEQWSPRQQINGQTARSPIEYTDLDVFVSRLEGSGREYEGFSQITSFLGPGKPTAATPAQIATLLPGIVSVDSRRTTPQGKVKLKLSLLGVRISKCPICLSQFKDKDKGVILPDCGHAAHQVCATRWFRDDSRCFVCREALKEG